MCELQAFYRQCCRPSTGRATESQTPPPGNPNKECAVLQAFYRQSSRELRRLSSVARSPVYSGFSEAIDGAPTIRGFSAQAAFSQQNVTGLEVLQRANYAGVCSVPQVSSLLLGLTDTSIVSWKPTRDIRTFSVSDDHCIHRSASRCIKQTASMAKASSNTSAGASREIFVVLVQALQQPSGCLCACSCLLQSSSPLWLHWELPALLECCLLLLPITTGEGYQPSSGLSSLSAAPTAHPSSSMSMMKSIRCNFRQEICTPGSLNMWH